MRIIISPAKNMRLDADGLDARGIPVFLDRAEQLLNTLRSMDYESLKKLLQCSDDIARSNYERYQEMNLHGPSAPALMAYDGIQYKYMAPQVFEWKQLEYVQEHLRILSGLYGVLKPLDGVVPYRLEMQARLRTDYCRNLYDFWGDSLAGEISRDASVVLNLASEEYAKAVRRHLPEGMPFINCIFGEPDGGRIREKGVYVKMARGEMVRFMAENNILRIDELRAFDRLGFSWNAELSTDETLVFLMDKSRASPEF